MDNTEYWDSVAGSKDFTLKFEAEEFLKELPSDAAVLDVGCGYGRTLIRLRDAGVESLAGCDISPKMIELAKQSVPEADLRVNKGVKLPFEDDSFDAVILLAVLTSIIDNQKQAKLIDEIARVLKSDGIIYVGDFLINEDERNIARYKKGVSINGNYGVFRLDEGAVLRHHDPDYIAALLGLFFAVDFQFVTHETMNGNTSNGFFFIGENCK